MRLFSIIVPIYGVEKYIARCVDSILAQSYSNIEIILVNDGSLDNCPSICDKYATIDNRVKVIHKENGGLVSARKAGELISTGEYVFCVDGDDWISEDYVEKFAKIIDEYSPDVVCCGKFRAYSDRCVEEPINYESGYYSKEDIKTKIYGSLIHDSKVKYFPPCIYAKAYKKGLYHYYQQQVDDRIKIGEDGACVIPCIYHATSLYIMPESLYFYRQNESSMTKEKKSFDWNGPGLIVQHIEKQIDVSVIDFQEQVYRKFLHDAFIVIVSQFYRKENYRDIVEEINRYVSDELFEKALNMCSFDIFKAQIMLETIKNKWWVLAYVYANVLK